MCGNAFRTCCQRKNFSFRHAAEADDIGDFRLPRQERPACTEDGELHVPGRIEPFRAEVHTLTREEEQPGFLQDDDEAFRHW